MSFTTFYENLFEILESELLFEKTKFINELSGQSKKIDFLYQKLLDTLDGGKRIRGILVLLGYQFVGGKDFKQAIKGAIAFEIFQSAILIHDDVIDQSSKRRGRDTIHYALGNNHYGNSQAICLGDIGFFWSIRVLNSLIISSEIKYLAINEFLNTMIKTGIGEVLDVETPFFETITKSDIEAIHYFKTAEYSIIGPLKLGAILGGAEKNVLKNIEKIGTFLGLAYQLKDDVMGLFGDETYIGKSTLSDIQEKKITHMYLYALENASKEDLIIIQSIYSSDYIAEKEVLQVKEIFKKCGALNESNKLIENYINLSKKSIEDSSLDKSFKDMLYSFSDFLQNRSN